MQYLLAYVNENHTVHNTHLPDEVFASSTHHYQKRYASKLIKNCDVEYDVERSRLIAKDIFKQRLSLKKQLFEI